jgi:hypothetical protein
MGGCVGRVLLGLRQWSWYGICNGEHGSCPLPPPDYSDARSPKQHPNEQATNPNGNLPTSTSTPAAPASPLSTTASRLHSPPQRHTLCRQRPTSIPIGVLLHQERSEPWALPQKKQPERNAASPPLSWYQTTELQLGNATLIRHYLPELSVHGNTIGFCFAEFGPGRTLCFL